MKERESERQTERETEGGGRQSTSQIMGYKFLMK